jgi:hyperosmotically inducible periplasmic protein
METITEKELAMKRTFLTQWLLVPAVLLGLGGCAGTAKQESVGEFVDDSVITAKVKSAFVEDKEVSALKISVETNKGVVQLSGFVSDTHESWKAAQLARSVNGVKSVRNDLAVK